MDGLKAPTLLILTCWTLFSASSQAQDLVDQMRNLLEQGYYNSAAQLNGPDLVNRFPDDPQARYLYAYALYLTGRTSEARVQLDLASTLQEQADPVHTHLNGLLKAAEGDPDTALTLLREAFQATQAYPYAMDWGRVAWQVGAYEEALEAYEAAATTEGGRVEPWPHLNRGRLLAFQSRYEEVIKALNTAIAVFEANDPGNPRPSPAYVEAYFRLGEVYEALKDLDQAEIYYRSAHFADPTYGPALDALERLGFEFE